MPDHCFPFQTRLNCVSILCVLSIWGCAYTSPWVSQSGASIRRAALAPRQTTALKGLQRALRVCTHQRFQSTVFFKTTIFTCPVHLSVLPLLCTAFGQRCDNPYNNLRSPKCCLSCDLFHDFCILGTLPKYTKCVATNCGQQSLFPVWM